jgi:hypothetical protein
MYQKKVVRVLLLISLIRDRLNTYMTEVISINKSVDVYIPLKSGILVDRI